MVAVSRVNIRPVLRPRADQTASQKSTLSVQVLSASKIATTVAMPLATSTGTPIARASSWITPWSAIGVRPHLWLGSLQPAVNGLVEHP